jgi:hypothetical protein
MRRLTDAFRAFFRRGDRSLYARRIGAPKVREAGDYRLVSFERDGVLDYDLYRQVQEEGNRRKIDQVWVNEDAIRRLAAAALERGPVRRVLCHGTRNGAEQRFFKAAIPGVEALGTEISSTATQFPDTIQWDFHDLKDEWRGSWDLLYSNSWDHAFDPERLFANWTASLRPDGLMALEHTTQHQPQSVTPLDPFGISFDGLVALVTRTGEMALETTIDGIDPKRERRIVVFRKAG